MTLENEAIRVHLKGIEKLLEKIDKTQEEQWKEITKHGNELIGLKGEISSLTKTNYLEISNLKERVLDSRTDVSKNTKFRQNMEGFSWIRHGLPLVSILLALMGFLYSIWPKQ